MDALLQLTGHEKDLGGGFLVRRLLPAAKQRSVGPFIFFDHFGPVQEQPGANHDVRPHPHIGLATVTYLFEGAMMHRDSLGTEQLIEPGAINWMTAGRGIVHSERRPEHLRDVAYTSHGLQLWTALPLAQEEAEPAFSHTPASDIPEVRVVDVQVRVLVGEAFGVRSPVPALGRTLYLDLLLPPGSGITLPALAQECALYSVDQDVIVAVGPDSAVAEVDAEIAGDTLPARTMGVLPGATTVRVEAPFGARVMVIGGDALEVPRHMWWNFVSSSKDRILRASADWEQQRMGHVPGETEFIPLPPTPYTPPEPRS